MLGQGVLRQCLFDSAVQQVTTIGRAATGIANAKLSEVVLKDLFDYSGVEDQLKGLDACFFCLGVSSNGMAEADYERLTYQLTLAAAGTLARLNPQMTFVYISGRGTDSTEKGRLMWARVKGRTENAIFALPFKAAYMFRVAGAAPVHGERSKTPLYQFFYSALKPIVPLLQRLFPDYIVTTEEIGRAMINVARSGFPKRILESPDIAACARQSR
jgi:hypothetical protein